MSVSQTNAGTPAASQPSVSPAPPAPAPAPQSGQGSVNSDDTRLVKSVELLKKTTKVDPKKLEGMTIAQQFDALSFLADNMPASPAPNAPITQVPVGSNGSNDPFKPKKIGDRFVFSIPMSEALHPKK